uniref:Uncharacterized protein n=1 Tax=Arundo donax TaxID=35708 RepID=A0A0A8YWF1_ARUDO
MEVGPATWLCGH